MNWIQLHQSNRQSECAVDWMSTIWIIVTLCTQWLIVPLIQMVASFNSKFELVSFKLQILIQFSNNKKKEIWFEQHTSGGLVLRRTRSRCKKLFQFENIKFWMENYIRNTDLHCVVSVISILKWVHTRPVED